MPTSGTRQERRLTVGVAAAIAVAVLAPLYAGCGSSRSDVAPSAFAKCGVSLTPGGSTFDAAGGTGHVGVSTQRECAWSVSSNAAWITFTSPSAGQGDGGVDFRVASNPDPSPRSGSLSAGDQSVSIQQRAADCTYQLSSTDLTVAASGGTRDVDVRASSGGCHWIAESQSEWITIKAGANGTGDGRVTFEAAPTSGPPRSGALAIAGRTVNVVQADGCAYAVTPASVSAPAAGSAASLAVAANAGCPWTAATTASWIGVTAGASGSGAGAVQLTVTRNTGPERSDLVSVAGTTVRITQASGCSFAVSPGSLAFGAGGGAAQATVTSDAACAWSTTSHDGWLSVSVTGSASGSGTLTISATANSGPARSGTVSVAGHTIAASQASGCTFSVSPGSVSFSVSGGAANISVTASDGACGWTAAGAPPWITLTSGATGSGTGQVVLTAEPNTGPPRTGAVSVAGQAVALSQPGGCSYLLSASSASFAAAGGAGEFQVTTTNGCRWKTTVQGGDGWLTLTRGDSGNGSGPVQFTVAPNTGPARSATLVIENHVFTITQQAAQ